MPDYTIKHDDDCDNYSYVQHGSMALGLALPTPWDTRRAGGIRRLEAQCAGEFDLRLEPIAQVHARGATRVPDRFGRRGPGFVFQGWTERREQGYRAAVPSLCV